MKMLSKYADENKLPIMDQSTFERITNDIGKEKFREDLAQYIADNRPKFPLKEISFEAMRQAFKGLQKQDVWEYVKPLEQIDRNEAFLTTPDVLETITVTGPTNNTTDPNMIIADFAGGSGTNSFTAGDTIMVGIQSDTDVTASTSKHFFTLVFEFDFSGLA